MSRKGKGAGKPPTAAQDAQGEAQAGAEVPEGLTQEEVAKRVGCAASTVWRAIARGDLEPLPGGRLPESAVEIMRGLRQAAAEQDEATASLERRLLAAQAGEREAKMQLRQLELERESGRFVELAQVERAGADAAQRILAVLRAMPQRIAMEVDAALSAPADRRAAAIEKIVAREVERALAEMRESLYLQAGTAGGTSEGNT
jgi:transposase